MGLTHHVYVDVAGTDRSGIVISLPKVTRPLSDVGECDIVLSNKAGAYKAAFSEMQRVAVSAARAPFSSQSDYFTGTDAAAPNARWTTGGSGTKTIQSNKLYLTGAAAGGWTYVKSTSGFSYPFTFTVWLSFGSMAANNGFLIELRDSTPNSYYDLTIDNGTKFYTYHRDGTAWHSDQNGTTTPVINTWYKIKCSVTSATAATFTVYDVDGVVLESFSTTHDSLSTYYIWLGVGQNAAFTCYYDSFLQTSSATVVADQLFEGVVDSVEFNAPPDTITLHCVDDAWELEKQYDDDYGRVTGELTPLYGAVDDIWTSITALAPSGMSTYCPDCAIHDHIEISSGTRRIDAINQVVDHTPYLGWYMLPMKHIVFVMPDTSPAPDAWTEATAGWATTNCTIATIAGGVDGAQLLYMNPSAANGHAERGDALGISLLDYRFLIVYMQPGDRPNPEIRIWENIAGNKYWMKSIPASWGLSISDFQHFVIRLPDSSGAHGWTSTNSPSPTGSIQRIEMEADSGGSNGIYFDVLYFVADKKLTSKYTLTPYIFGASRVKDANQVGQVIVQGSGVSAVVTDATVTATYGLREQLINDQNITVAQKADAYARAYLNAQSWDDTADPITVQVINPGDMYNVMPGDTLTLTVANMNLSSATRTLISREDSVTNQTGWITVLRLSMVPMADRIMKLWELAKRKRY